MSRTLNYCFFRRLTAYLRPKGGVNLSQICTSFINDEAPKVDINDGLRKACEEGDVAIIRLMDQLKEVVIIVSKEYRTCLVKQIEITRAAAIAGPLSEVWDELPKYRVLADELNKELTDYMTMFNTIGQMSYDDSLIEFVTGSNDKLDQVGIKYNNLKILLVKEFEENKKIEKELLEIKRESILKNSPYS